MKRLVLLVIFSIVFFISEAQYFQTGQDPASIRWRQINTKNFQLIYPDYYEKKAQKLAPKMEAVYERVSATLDDKPKKISIILHTQTVVSNGLVAWAPKRAEFYTIPHQDIYAQNWLEQLAIHEFRHVVQIDKINEELPKIIKYVLGEQGTALVFGAYIPWWFIEGDAVVLETALSNSGRGRFPSFLMEEKALAVEKGIYKYDKAYNSSFHNYVPDHYQLGYFIVGGARVKYGSELWNSVLERVGKKPFSLTPFNRALKDFTGQSKSQLYESVFEQLKERWVGEDQQYTSPYFSVISPKNRTYSNYKYGHYLNDSVIVSYRTALDKIPAFVKINSSGSEEKIHIPGTIFNESVSYNGPWVVWSEKIPDPRWEHSGKSLIRLLNIETGIKHSFYTEFTAFAPVISPTREYLLVVESDFTSKYYLSVYRIADSKLIHRFQTENNNYFLSPEWINSREAVAVALFPEGKRLIKINFETNKSERIFENNLGEIKNLKVVDNELFFTATLTGKNAIYKMDLEDKSVQLIYEPRFGAENPDLSPNGNKIIISDYTADGFRIIELERDSLTPIPVDQINKNNYSLADSLAKQEQGVIDFESIELTEYPSKKFSKLTGLVHFHSWAPLAIDPGDYTFNPGISILSQSKLGTSDINLGYRWKSEESTGEAYIKYSYKGWYPVFDIEVNKGKSASKSFHVTETIDQSGAVVSRDTSIKRYTWNETNMGIDVRLPLNLSQGKFNRYLQPEIKFNYSFYSHDSSTPEGFFKGNFQTLSYRLYYQQLLHRSYQDVYPNFGFYGDIIYQHSPSGEVDFGSLALLQGHLFLPGFMPNHGIKIYSGRQHKKSDSHNSFSERISYPRGWGKINTNDAFSLAFDYKLPLFYPEWNVGSIAYLKRINASVFADYASLKGNLYSNGNLTGTFNKKITSYGVELTGDANFLRFYAPVEIGTRASYMKEISNFYFEFLFSIDFNSL